MSEPLIYRRRTGETTNVVDFWLEVRSDRVELHAERGEESHRVLVIEDGVIVVETADQEILEHFGFKLGLKAESDLHMPLIEDDEDTAMLTWDRKAF